MIYNVYDHNFVPIGTIRADSAHDAFIAAKKRWPFVVGIMVEPVA